MSIEQENKEWLNEYPALGKVNPANAFKVPVNYFDEMEGRVMEEIRLQKFKEADPQNGFTVPANYFDDLSVNIQSRIAIEQVLDSGKGFKVPDNYFDELSGNIQSRVAIEQLLDTEKGFTVPENYFDELSGNIQSRVAIEQLLNTEQGFLVPDQYFDKLAQNIEARVAVDELIGQDEGFTVPANYFEGLEARILQNTTGVAQPAKQNKPVIRKLWNTDVFKYASAACFTLFVGAAVLMSEFNETAIHDRSDVHKALSKVSKSDMEEYLELNGDAPTLMENVDPNSLSLTDSDAEIMN